MLQYALDDAAAVGVRAQSVHLPLEGVDDELQRMRLHALDALLHHVVAILVLDALEHVSVQFAHHLLLLLCRDGLQRFLDHAAPVHLQRQRQHVAAQLLGQGCLLLRSTKLKELLDYVVAKHIGHQIVGRSQDLAEH